MTEPVRRQRKPRAGKAVVERLPSGIRNRVIDFKRLPASEISDNERNWRTHPEAQTGALKELLEGVGIAGALTAYYSERNGGKLTLIDGHARRDQAGDDEWPVLILDVDDAEADQLLAVLDPMTGMAGADREKLAALLEDVKVGTPRLADLVQTLGMSSRDIDPEGTIKQHAAAAKEAAKQIPEMELQPFEHYDYVMLLCKTTHDWISLCELLGIEKVKLPTGSGRKKIGLGRVIDASRVVELLKQHAPKEEKA